MVSQNCTSEVAERYVKQIEKYRSMLFTFLAYEGIPWNNNSAEHAIKSFAKYRRFANGMATERTIKDYLIMLSVCLSCEYRGIDFLKGLLGETEQGRSLRRRRFAPFRPKLHGSKGALGLAASGPQLALGPKDGMVPGDENERCKRLNLNKFLPKMLEYVKRSTRHVRFRSVLAVDLWPVKLDPAELGLTLKVVVESLREGMATRKTIIIAAKNIRFDRLDAATSLIGRYVVVSISDGGHFVPANSRPPVSDRNSCEPRTDQSLYECTLLQRQPEVRQLLRLRRPPGMW